MSVQKEDFVITLASISVKSVTGMIMLLSPPELYTIGTSQPIRYSLSAPGFSILPSKCSHHGSSLYAEQVTRLSTSKLILQSNKATLFKLLVEASLFLQKQIPEFIYRTHTYIHIKDLIQRLKRTKYKNALKRSL